jgi:hypothetical protein
MSLLSRVSGAGGGGEEKACTSPIESHFDSRLIYFLLPLVRMQMRRRAAPCRAVPNFFQRGPAVPGPGAGSGFLREPSHLPTFAFPFLSLSLSLSLSLFLPASPPRISIPLICLALIVRVA